SKGLLVGAIALGVMAIGGAVAAFTLFDDEDSQAGAPPTPTNAPTEVVPTAAPTGAQAVVWKGPCPETMKVVPGGKFQMGSDDPRFPLWKPAHEVTIDSFCLAVHEVTVADYEKCVEEGGCKPADTAPSFPKAQDQSDEDHARELAAYAELCNWEKPG